MPFYVRRSVRFGPVRVNLSKSGLGVSAGIKGARIGTGPRGAYVHMGAGGLYYRQRLGGSPEQSPEMPAPVSDAYLPGEILTADISLLVGSSAKDTLARINHAITQTKPLAPIGWGVTVLLGFAFWLSTPLLSLLACSVGAGVSIWLGKRDQEQRTTDLFYDLGEDAASRFKERSAVVESLSRSERVWRLNSSQATDDWKRHAGAGSLVTRSAVDVSVVQPPFLRTNVEVWGIRISGLHLLFFPDRLLVFENGSYGAVPYDDLKTESSVIHYREHEGRPGDSTLIGHTWQYVRRDGGPDRRFANNPEVPILEYGYLELTSRAGLHIVLMTSSQQAAHDFAKGLKEPRAGGKAKATEPAT